MIHLFKSAAARAVTYGLIGVIVIGLLIGAVRIALPFADIFRSQLEDLLTETLGLEVRVGRLGLRLAGVVPQLTLLDAELLNPSSRRTQLSLEQLRVDFSLSASLQNLAPKINSVTLVGAHLVIKRLADGTVTVAGLEGVEGGDPKAMTFFLGNGRFLLTNSDVRWIDEKAAPGAAPLHLSDVQIYFENMGERHRVGIRARLYDNPETRLRLVGDLHGTPHRPAEWSGGIYLRWKDRNLEQALRGRLPDGLSIGTATVEIESWNDLKHGILSQSLSRFSVSGLTVRNRAAGERAPLHVNLLEGLLRWRRVENGWHLNLRDLALTRDGHKRPVSDMGIRFATGDDEGWTVEGGKQFLDLTDAYDLFAQLPETLTETLDALRQMRPRGALHDLRFRFAHRPGLPTTWDVAGRIEALGLKAHGRIPGLEGLAVELAGNDSQGGLVLTAEDLTLDLPRLFPKPIRLDVLDGQILWERGDDGVLRVSSPRFAASNADVATVSRFSLSLPAGDDPVLDLQTDFRDVKFTAVRRYIPTKLLSEKLGRWLGAAFEAGRVTSGTLLFRGVPGDFPFDQGQGQFQVLFAVEGGALKYHQDWPPLEDITGEVQFLNSGMEIIVSRAGLLNSELISGYAEIPDLKRAVAVRILGRTEGPFADGFKILGDTPLRRKLGGIAETFDVEGVARMDLNMAIPLTYKGHKGPLELSGELTWPRPAKLTVANRDIELTDLGGKLHFTESTLRADSVRAKLWGAPIRLHIDTLQGAEDGPATTRIRANGKLSTSVLARRFPSPVWGNVRGRSRWELRLDARRGEANGTMPPLDFDLRSNLAGVAIELPEPLGKQSAVTRQLHFSGRLAAGEALQARGGYGDLGINLDFKSKEDGKLRLARGTFYLGGDAKPLPGGEGLYLSGSIASLDLPAWLNWWETHSESAGGRQDGRTPLLAADLRVQRLLLADMALNEVRFDLDRRGNRWEAKLTARELDGKVSIPHLVRREPIRIDLERLDLKGILGHEGKEGQALAERKRADPRRAHSLDLRVERLLWGENLLGKITLRSQPTADGLDFTEMTLKGPSMSIDGHANWKRRGGGQRTNLTLTAKGSDLGEFLRSLEFKSMFYKSPAELDLSLAWPGGPAQFSLSDMEGRVEIEVGAGSLLEVEPGVGRMLGILNLEAVQRRLTLDFSDLFDRGFAFEKISGELKIQGGKADINDLEIEGPSANVSIVGHTDLVKQELDQIVTVTPRIGTGVAIASAVAGGPLVGAAVFLADRVSGGAMDRLGRHQYFLSGPWAEPKVRRGTFGSDPKEDAGQELFLAEPEPEPGRAGAAGSREAQKAQADPPAAAKTSTPARKPGLFGDTGGENLFLEGH